MKKKAVILKLMAEVAAMRVQLHRIEAAMTFHSARCLMGGTARPDPPANPNFVTNAAGLRGLLEGFGARLDPPYPKLRARAAQGDELDWIRPTDLYFCNRPRLVGMMTDLQEPDIFPAELQQGPATFADLKRNPSPGWRRVGLTPDQPKE